jgi:threonine synthase
LLARYDLSKVDIGSAEIARRAPDLWRYHELLPVRRPESVLTLGEGMTPLLPMGRLGAHFDVERLLLKDDGLLPTGSFKARGAAVGVSRAVELGAQALSMPTNGNAGAAWAAYAARAGVPIHVAMPVDAPVAARVEVAALGGKLTLVRGHIGEAGRWLADRIADREAAGDHPPFDVSTLREPYRVEGKKTMAFEIVEQLGWRMPDVVVYPTGGGVGLIGMHKAFVEMRDLGWVDGDLPRLVSVQSTGCAPIVAAFETGATEAAAWPDPRTVAFGITVPKPLGDFLILQTLYETNGVAIAVDDRELLSDLALLGRLEGVFACPEGAATISAVRTLRQSGWLSGDETVVALNTGAGALYPDAVQVEADEVDPP